MIDLLFSAISLSSLLFILVEAEESGVSLRRRWPVVVWAVCLLCLALLALTKVVRNLHVWGDGRLLMVLIAAANFLAAAALLLAWVLWIRTRRTPT
jgi:hypothetical protein